MLKRRSLIVSLLGFVLLIVIFFIWSLLEPRLQNNKKDISTLGYSLNRENMVTMQLADTVLEVKVVSTNEERRRGLSGVVGLEPDEGMFFVFDSDGYYGIWMKDMLFSIDILWLNSNKEIVHIESFVDPDTYPTVFKPDKPARYVLEVNAGFVVKHKINVGDTIVLPEEGTWLMD